MCVCVCVFSINLPLFSGGGGEGMDEQRGRKHALLGATEDRGALGHLPAEANEATAKKF